MSVANIGLMHHNLCRCKVKGFHAVSSIERNISQRVTCKGCDKIIVYSNDEEEFKDIHISNYYYDGIHPFIPTLVSPKCKQM